MGRFGRVFAVAVITAAGSAMGFVLTVLDLGNRLTSPERRAYVDKLIRWAEGWESRVQSSFNNQTPTMTAGQKSPPPANVSQEERLVKLRELRDKGLITPAEYESRRRSILESL